jgi:ParB-like chromosome segregation protein Spo0J
MSPPDDWQNPINAVPGQRQQDVDPARLRPGRTDLVRSRLEYQRKLIKSGQARFTPIQVSREGVIIDGHHYVRAAAEEGRVVEVLVSTLSAVARADSILNLPLR